MSTTNTALEIISSANFSPTEHLLLTHFIDGAVDSVLAATYLISRMKQNHQRDVETALNHFKKDWRTLVTRLTTFDTVSEHLGSLVRLRDGPRCSMTKDSTSGSVSTVEPAYVIPPSMLHDLETAEEGRLFMMLEAFLSPSYVTHLRTQLANQEGIDENSLQNILLLSPSIHRAFREGHVAIRLGSQPSGDAESQYGVAGEIQNAWYLLETLSPGDISGLSLGDGAALQNLIRFKFYTPDPKTLPTPSVFLFEVHRRFANALHLFSIEDTVAHGWPKPSGDLLGLNVPVLRQAFYYIWLCIPLWMRLRCYLLLGKFGSCFYGTEIEPSVQRLPFGLVLKQCFRAQQNEPNALRLVERYTSIPAPRVIDVGEYNGTTCLVMTRLRGQMLDDVLHLMSYAERNRFADDLGFYVAQLQKIPNTAPFLFCNTLGGPIIDHRIPDGSGGPFRYESDFNNHLTSHLGCSPAEIVGEQNLKHDHRSCFTHLRFPLYQPFS